MASHAGDGEGWRLVATPVLVPTLLFSLSHSAVVAIIAAHAMELGGSLAVAGLVSAMLPLGQLVGYVPGGWAIDRFGERPILLLAVLVGIAATAACALAPDPLVLAVAACCLGMAHALFALARQVLVTVVVTPRFRGRAFSMLVGSARLGTLVGPLMAAGAILLGGSAPWAFVASAAGLVLGGVALLAMPEPALPEARREAGAATPALGAREGIVAAIVASAPLLLRLGTAAMAVTAMRASRVIVIPLWALSIGLSAADLALLLGAASALEFVLFYTGGQIMDRFGRLWVSLPSLLGFAVGHLALAGFSGISLSVQLLIGVTILFALMNGLNGGFILTLGADLADPQRPAPFLSAWRFTADIGQAAAPLVLAGVISLSSLAMASVLMAGIALGGAVLLGRYLPRYLPSPVPRG